MALLFTPDLKLFLDSGDMIDDCAKSIAFLEDENALMWYCEKPIKSGSRTLKAVVNMKYPRIPVFHHFR